MPAAVTDILTLTFNPALDLATEVETLRPGAKLRCAAPVRDPGGGGLNVSRAIAALGGQSTALVALSGHTGRELAALIDEAPGLTLAALPGPEGETRTSLAVTDQSSGQQYRFVMPGPHWSAAQTAAALDAIRTALPPGGIVILSGSLPPGMPGDLPARLAAVVAGAGGRLIVDTSGAPLHRLVDTPARPAPWILRMDGAEAQELAGHPLPTPADSARFAAGLIARGVAGMVILARGAEGSVLVTPDRSTLVHAPKVPVVSRIGAGDSFVGALALALARGAPPIEAVQQGVAAASGTVSRPGTSLCTADDVARLMPACRADPLGPAG